MKNDTHLNPTALFLVLFRLFLSVILVEGHQTLRAHDHSSSLSDRSTLQSIMETLIIAVDKCLRMSFTLTCSVGFS